MECLRNILFRVHLLLFFSVQTQFHRYPRRFLLIFRRKIIFLSFFRQILFLSFRLSLLINKLESFNSFVPGDLSLWLSLHNLVLQLELHQSLFLVIQILGPVLFLFLPDGISPTHGLLLIKSMNGVAPTSVKLLLERHSCLLLHNPLLLSSAHLLDQIHWFLRFCA